MLNLFTRSDVLVQFTLIMAASVANGFSASTSPSSSSPSSKATTQCAIVGFGVLGTSLCRQILETTDWDVIGITQTTNRHRDIRESFMNDSMAHRVTLTTRDAIPSDTKYDNVVFCAPPSGSDDYPGTVKDAVDNLWRGPESGVFCFTSSGAM